MEKERRQLLTQVRDYLLEHPSIKINLQAVCDAIGCKLNTITQWAPTPNALLEQILELKAIELSEILDYDKNSKESAIDSMVISGQEIYENFDLLSPAKYVFVRKIKPALYQKYQARKFEIIERHLRLNLDKGIKTGEYKTNIDKADIINKYIIRIKEIHTEEYLISEHFTFTNIFSNIFEDYLEEVATEENWNYFRKRKQFYEAISFVNR